MPPRELSTPIGRLVVVGVGLIGGSVALAARERGVAHRVVGVVRSEASRRRVLASGVVEHATRDLAAAAASADAVVVCTPVGALERSLLRAAESCPAGVLLTDAGSTKAELVAGVEAGLARLAARPLFVGSHPLAGDHRTGPESARADLFAGRLVVLTPTPATPPAAIEYAEGLWHGLGAQTTRMPPAEHDRRLAQTSHGPHVVAASLAAATPADALPLTATGWRDATRIAAGDPELWREIVMANRGATVAAIDRVLAELAGVREAIAGGDHALLTDLLTRARERRDAVGD